MTPSRSRKTRSGPPRKTSKPNKGGAAKRPRSKGPKKGAATAGPSAPPAENPRAHALAKRIAELISEKKAIDIVILDVRGKTSYADYFVVASGESERQVSAMAENVETKLKEEGQRPIGTEGYDTGHWVLLDYGEVVAHLFFTEVRAFYDLEGLWADAKREQVA